MRHRLANAAMALGAIALPAAGLAQPGDHIRAGDAEIVPDIDIGVEYRTNVYREQVSEWGGAPNLHISPGLRIQSSTPELEYSLVGQYMLRKYFQRPYTSADRYSDFVVAGRIQVRKRSALGLTLVDDASLVNSTVDMEGAIRNGGAYVTRLRNHLKAGLDVRPGTALEITLGGQWDFDDYQVPEGAQISGSRSFNRRQQFGPTLDARWTFFPRTALVVSSSYLYHRWDDNWILAIDQIPTPNQFDFGTHLGMPDSTHFKVDGGIQGRFTERIVVTVRGGYGSARYDEQTVINAAAGEAGTDATELTEDAGFYQDVAGQDHLLVLAELRYELAPDTSISVGYTRDFDDSWFTNYLAYDRIYGRLTARVGSKLGATAEGSVRIEDYVGEGPREDIVLRVGGDVTYYLSDWASVKAGAKWDERASSFTPSEYDDVNIHMMATFTY